MTNTVTPLLEWIDDHESVLILYPQSIDPSNVVAAFLTNPGVSGKTILMMVQDPKSVNAAAGADLPDQLYIPYDDSKYLRSVLAGKAYIVIDSPTMFRLSKMNRFFKAKKPESKAVFFGSVGMLTEDLDYIKEQIPNISVVRMIFAKEGPELIYSLQATTMGDEQTRRWEIRRQNEIDVIAASDKEPEETGELDKQVARVVPTKQAIYDASNLIKSLQIGNFLYPTEIQDILDQPKDEREHVPSDSDVGQGGWMTKDIVRTISNHSKKIMNLITIIVSKYDQKHVIYTKYLEHYGVNLLDTILHYMGIPHVVITGADEVTERFGKYQAFSGSPTDEQRVLLTNVLPNFDIGNTSNLHFLEGVSWNVYRAFFDRMYRHRLFRMIIPHTFTVYFHVAQKNDDSDGSDAVLYRATTEYIQKRQQAYADLYAKSIPIGFLQDRGLVVLDTET